MEHPSATHSAARVPLPPDSWPAHLARDSRWSLAQRVIAGTHFARSSLLSNFLLYIVAETIEGRDGEITEHQIGVHVFDRPVGYRTIEDNIVRTYARQLRRRLAEYFAGEGGTETTHIEIPLGGYVPVFVPRSKIEPAPDVRTFPIPVSINIQTDPGVRPPAETRSVRTSRWKRRSLQVSLIALYSLLLIGLTIYASRKKSASNRPADSANALWTALFDGRTNTYVVPADAGFNLLEDLSHRPLPLADYIREDYLEMPLSGIDAHSAADLRSQQFTSFIDFQIVASLARIPEFNPQRVLLRFPRDLRLDDLKNANAVLIGSVGSNPWASIAESSANFRIVYSEGMEGATIINQHPQAGEAATYASHWNEPAHETFALIAFLPNLGGNGHVLLLQGLDVAGTQAAAEALFHPATIEPILRRATRPDGSVRFFEILLRSKSIESNAAGIQVIGSRIY